MSPIVFMFVFVALIVLSGSLALVTFLKKKTKRTNPLISFFSTTTVTALVLMLFAVGFNRWIPGETMLITSTGEVKGVFPERTSIWRWDSRLDGTEWVSYAKRDESVRMSVSPITENPKVRGLTYEVTVEILGSSESYLVLQEVTEGKGIRHWLKDQLFEFNEAHSRDLAKFYNPLDEDQQDEFEEMVRSFLSSRSPSLNFQLFQSTATRFDRKLAAHYLFKEARFDLH